MYCAERVNVDLDLLLCDVGDELCTVTVPDRFFDPR